MRASRGRKWAVSLSVLLGLAGVLVWLSGGSGTRPDAPSVDVLSPSSVAHAKDAEVVRLERTGGSEIPLHPAERAHQVSARVPNGTLATVVQRGSESGWLRVTVSGGIMGWVSPRYVAGGRRGGAPTAPKALPVDSPWHSRATCQRLVKSGTKKPIAQNQVRLGSWNVRWFPDGMLGKGHHGEKPTDVAWLGCVIAWMRVDVLLVQEFRRTDLAKSQTTTLLATLDTLTGGKWQAQFDSCAGAARQHVGVLYDSKRVRASHWQNLASLNPSGADACAGSLRPGFGAYFRFPGGLDLHLVDVHLKSGPTKRSYELRRLSIAGLAAAYRERQTVAPDADLILVGDLNTMGCEGCATTPSQSTPEAAEALVLDAELKGLVPAFRRLPASARCSEYYDGEGGLLDHYVVTAAMQEVGASAHAEVEGYCREVGCADLPAQGMPEAYRALSDHCPVLLDVPDRDLDP